MRSKLGLLFLGIFLVSGSAHAADAKATFAGGCFWCMEPAFDKIPGVKSVMPGYTGGKKKKPTYHEVSDGNTGHAESVQIIYDPAKVKFEQLLDIYWENVDPTDPDGQNHDRGTQYRTAIFYHDDAQKKAAEKSKDELSKLTRFKDKKIVTEIVAATEFYPAEEYHRAYYKKSPAQYENYHVGSGREQFLDKVWGKDRTKSAH